MQTVVQSTRDIKESAFYLRKLARVLADHWGISPRHWDGRNVYESLREYEASSGGACVYWACVEHYADEASVFPAEGGAA